MIVLVLLVLATFAFSCHVWDSSAFVLSFLSIFLIAILWSWFKASFPWSKAHIAQWDERLMGWTEWKVVSFVIRMKGFGKFSDFYDMFHFGRILTFFDYDIFQFLTFCRHSEFCHFQFLTILDSHFFRTGPKQILTIS